MVNHKNMIVWLETKIDSFFFLISFCLKVKNQIVLQISIVLAVWKLFNSPNYQCIQIIRAIFEEKDQ